MLPIINLLDRILPFDALKFTSYGCCVIAIVIDHTNFMRLG